LTVGNISLTEKTELLQNTKMSTHSIVWLKS